MCPRRMLVWAVAVFSCLIWAETPEEVGLRLAEKLDRANNGFVGEYAELEMILVNEQGDKTVRKMILEVGEKEGDGDLYLNTFLWPADVKGTRMLTWSHKTGDDDQWLFLPALRRVKRISSRNKSGSFMGSEFSYEDLGSQEVAEYSHRFLKEESVDSGPCWVLERVPVSKKSGYSKELVWFAKAYMNPLKIEYYDRKGELLKVAAFRNYTKYDSWWRAGEMEMKNVQTNKKSMLIWRTREMGRHYDQGYFSSENLSEN